RSNREDVKGGMRADPLLSGVIGALGALGVVGVVGVVTAQLSLGCAPSAHQGGEPSAAATFAPASPTPSANPSSPLAATLPGGPPRFAPSQAEIAVGAAIPGASLTDIDTCDQCHADIAAQWKTSAHAFASFNNPIYRASIDRFRADVNHE